VKVILILELDLGGEAGIGDPLGPEVLSRVESEGVLKALPSRLLRAHLMRGGASAQSVRPVA